MTKRLLPLSGIIFFALALVAIVVLGGSTPDAKATPTTIISFYSSHYNRESAAPFVLAIAALFFALFAVTLWHELTGRRDDPTGRIAGGLLLVGGAAATVGFLVAAGMHLALAEAVHHRIGPAGAQALNAIDVEMFQPFSIGTAIMLLGAAGLTIRRGGAWKWLGWVAAILGVASFTPAGFFAFIGANLWILVAGIVLALAPTRKEQV